MARQYGIRTRPRPRSRVHVAAREAGDAAPDECVGQLKGERRSGTARHGRKRGGSGAISALSTREVELVAEERRDWASFYELDDGGLASWLRGHSAFRTNVNGLQTSCLRERGSQVHFTAVHQQHHHIFGTAKGDNADHQRYSNALVIAAQSHKQRQPKHPGPVQPLSRWTGA